MPAPSAAWIQSMLSPYSGFKPDSGNALGFAQLGQQRAQLGQRQKEFGVDSARQQGHLDLMNRQFDTSQANDLRDRQMKAFTAFQAAVDSGDTEQAALAANALRLTGVDVEEYGAGEGGTGGRMPTSLDMAARESPSAAVAQAQAQAGSRKQEELKALDKIGRDADPTAASQPDDAQVSETLDYYDKSAPVDEEDAKFREEYKRYVAEQKQGASDDELMPPADVSARPVTTTGLPEATLEAPQQATQARGYRLNFGGKVIDISPDSVLERQRARVQGALMPLFNSANTPEEQAAAKAALEAATQAVGMFSPDKAMLLGIDFYQAELDREAKTKRARIVGGGRGAAAAGGGYGGTPGLTKEGAQVQAGLHDDVQSWLNSWEQRNNVQKAREALQNGDKAVALLASDNPVSQRAALTATLKQWFSSVTSNTELNFVVQSAGVLNQLEMEFNKYMNEGRLPAEFVRKLRQSVATTQNQFRQHMLSMGQKAADEFLNVSTIASRMPEEQQQQEAARIYGRFGGGFAKKFKPPGAQGAGGTGEPKKAPKGPRRGRSADEEADELLK